MRYAYTARSADGGTCSCDKAQLVFKLRKRAGTRLPASPVQGILDYIASAGWLVYEHWTTKRIGAYRDQFSITATADGDTFWLGAGLNGPGLPLPQVKVEFNPNKVWPRPALVQVLAELHRLAKHVELKQWDFAVDWPEPREHFTMVKDARLYEETARSRADRTQYVGQRNAPGRCKLYNKQMESHLSCPMTRLEVTVAGYSMARAVAAIWPTVYRLRDVQTGPEVAALNDTDRFILGVLLDAPDKIGELGRRKRERMAALLDGMQYKVPFDAAAYSDVSRFVRGLLNAETVTNAVEGRLSFWDYLNAEKDGDLTKSGL